MRTEQEIREQLDSAYRELERIAVEVPVGNCEYRKMLSYIEGLQFALGDE